MDGKKGRGGEGESAMSLNLPEILSLSAEPALLVQKGKIAYANEEAARLLGTNCTGEDAEALLGHELCRYPARAYLMDAWVDGARYILRVNRTEEGRLVFLGKPKEAPPILNEAFLYSLRSNLMTLGVAADKLRPAAEDRKDGQMLDDLTALSASYFKLMRLSENASFVHSLFERQAIACPQDLDLSLLCQSALDIVEDAFPELSFLREIPAGLRVNADPVQFRQLLFNLLSNCLSHARPSRIQVKLLDTPESVILSVVDNGVGIPPEELHTVFDRYRYGYSLKEIHGGAGLGLTAARGVAQLHGGTLLLESRIDQGTAVRASFSKRTAANRFGAGKEFCSMRDALLGLADCLPVEAFDAKYMD